MAFVQTLMNSKKHIDEVDSKIDIEKNAAVCPLLEKLRNPGSGVEADQQKIGMVAATVFMALLLSKWTVSEIETFVIEILMLMLFFKHVLQVLFNKPRRPNSAVIGEMEV